MTDLKSVLDILFFKKLWGKEKHKIKKKHRVNCKRLRIKVIQMCRKGGKEEKKNLIFTDHLLCKNC